MEQRTNIGGSIDLLALKGAVLIPSKNDPKKLLLFIPIDEAKLAAFKRENGSQSCYLNFFGLNRPDDQRGNDFMLTRSLTQDEDRYNQAVKTPEERLRGEILGNAKYLKPKIQEAQATTTAQNAGIVDDDLPY